MMTYEEIIETIGTEAYAGKALEVRGRSSFNGGTNDDLIYEISNYIWDSPEFDDSERIGLIARFYADIPCTAWLSEIYLNYYRGLSAQVRREYLDYLHEFLASGDDSLIEPIVYSLSVDLLDTSDTISEAWTVLVRDYRNLAVMRLLFSVSSMVPYELKEQAYQAVLHVPQMHQAVFDSLYNSCFFALGDIQPVPALHMLRQLDLDQLNAQYKKLYTALLLKTV
jgi:hypothetical protein